MKNSIKPVVATLSTTLLLSLGASAMAAGNPFVSQELAGGYQQLADNHAGKTAEGSCGADKKGDGSCGSDMSTDKKADGSCGSDKKADGSCGSDMDTNKGAAADKKAEGKCGEGKCGSNK